MAGKDKQNGNIERLEARLEQLRQDAQRRQIAATSDIGAEIASLEAELDGLYRAKREAAQAEHDAERAAVARDVAGTEQAIVAAIDELLGLLAALDERHKRATELGVQYKTLGVEASPLLPNSGLASALNGICKFWERGRRDLRPDLPPLPSREREAVRTREQDLRSSQERYDSIKQRIEQWEGDRHGQTFRQVLGSLEIAAEQLKRYRTRLREALEALVAKGEATDEDRRRLSELSEGGDDRITLTL